MWGSYLMEFSEIAVVLIVYSVLFVFFLIPFHNERNLLNHQINFKTILKETLFKMVFHKKAICALILVSFTLFCIWSSYEGAEYHINTHSGYPPIDTDYKAIYAMCGVLVYTVVLYFLIAIVRTLKIVKN